MRRIKWQINLLTKHPTLGSYLSVYRCPRCLRCQPRDGLTPSDWEVMHGQKLRAMVIHHAGVKTSTSFLLRKQQVMGMRKSGRGFFRCLAHISHNAVGFVNVRHGRGSWVIFYLECSCILFLHALIIVAFSISSLLYISHPCLPAALGWCRGSCGYHMDQGLMDSICLKQENNDISYCQAFK